MGIKKLTREEARTIVSFLGMGWLPERIVEFFRRQHGKKITLAQVAYMQRRIERLGVEAAEV